MALEAQPDRRDLIKAKRMVTGEKVLIISCEENLYDFPIEYRIAVPDLPSAEELIDLFM